MLCSNRGDPSSSSVAVQRVVYVDQHGKVLAQPTAPAVMIPSLTSYTHCMGPELLHVVPGPQFKDVPKLLPLVFRSETDPVLILR